MPRWPEGRRWGQHHPRFLLSLEGISQPVEYPGRVEYGVEDIYYTYYRCRRQWRQGISSYTRTSTHSKRQEQKVRPLNMDTKTLVP